MNDPRPDTPDVGAAVHALYPRLKGLATMAKLALLGIALLTFAAAVWSYQMMDGDPDAKQAVLVALVLGGLAMSFVVTRMRRMQEALVMPSVARAVGLTYDKNASAFLAALPPRLLPKAAFRRAEDVVTGTLGHHTIRMCEVTVETGGKRSRTLFQGVVAQFPNRVKMPPFFLAPLVQTAKGLLFPPWISTEGLYHHRDVTGPSGESYGLWTPWNTLEEPPALAAVVDVLTQLETWIGGQFELFTAISDSEEMHIALSHSRDLFQVGGLFPKEEQLFSDVATATRDLLIPLNLARDLIAAEELAGKGVKGA